MGRCRNYVFGGWQDLDMCCPDVKTISKELCMKMGTIFEVHNMNTIITHSICVARYNEKAELKVSPCGGCQERLWYWGPHVKAAITNLDQIIVFKTLEDSNHFIGLKPIIIKILLEPTESSKKMNNS